MQETTNDNNKNYVASSPDFVIGVIFLTSGLIMKHVCYEIDDEVCERLYHDGNILVIVGTVLVTLPFIFLCLCIPCILVSLR
jgi:hypothetical protein